MMHTGLIGGEATPAERAVGIAERLYEARRVLRWLLGDQYAARVADPMRVLAGLAGEQGGVLGALHCVLLDMRKDALANSGLGTLLAAAAAELIEPDGQTPVLADAGQAAEMPRTR